MKFKELGGILSPPPSSAWKQLLPFPLCRRPWYGDISNYIPRQEILATRLVVLAMYCSQCIILYIQLYDLIVTFDQLEATKIL